MEEDQEFVMYYTESSWEEHKLSVHYSTEKIQKLLHTKMKKLKAQRNRIPNISFIHAYR